MAAAQDPQWPFHGGEQAVQRRVGVRERIEQMGQRAIRTALPEEFQRFFRQLPYLVVGSVDEQQRVWASLLTGAPGFVAVPSEQRLVVHGSWLPGDPLRATCRPGAPLATLGIELTTRRRNRVNGRVVRVAAAGFELAVEQCFGNCKKYIQVRTGGVVPDACAVAAVSVEGPALTGSARQLLERCDTAFIATASAAPELGGAEGVDVSHRGGRPGFIRVHTDGAESSLLLPDFSGNFMFNTFGNLESNPRAGLLALDFETGSILSLTGSARVHWDSAASLIFAGAERLLEFRVDSGWLWQGIAHTWSAPEPSPHLAATGSWPG